jgi:hypothetical protein
VIIGSTVQASVGFGFALIVVPLLALINPVFVPGPTLLASLLLATIMTLRGHKSIEYVHIGKAAFGLLAGAGLGALAFSFVPTDDLPKLFGGLILLAVVLTLRGWKIPITSGSLLTASMISGVMGTMAGIHGPPLALLYQRETGNRVRAMLAILFVIGYSLSLIALYLAHFIRMREVFLGCSLLPGVVMGYVLSRYVARRLDKGYLRSCILVIATFSGITLLLRP